MIFIFRFFEGYLRLKIFGDCPERFINICAAARIGLWNIRRESSCIYANFPLKHFLRLRSLRRRSHTRVKILSQRGVLFICKPYLKRYGLAIGAVFFLLVNIIMSNFVWNIRVVGNKKIPTSEILKMCDEIGLREGCFIPQINEASLRLRLLINHPELSYASIIVEGSHLTVYVSETDRPHREDDTPSNFIASRDGIIERVEVSRGRALVKKGQAVVKGQLLASGTVEYTDGSTHFTRCTGSVTAQTRRELEEFVPFRESMILQTGKTTERKVLTFFGKNILLGLNPVTFSYNKSVQTSRIETADSYIPISLHSVEFRETRSENIRRTPEQALALAQKRLEKAENQKLSSAEIVDYSEKITTEKDGIRVKRVYNCIENIEISEKIKINIVN